MEIKKITNKLSFEVEAQDNCRHGNKRLKSSCSSDCKTAAFAMETGQMVRDYYCNNGPANKCYFWGYNYSCETSCLF